MMSIFADYTKKPNDYDHLSGAIKVYSERKVLQWLDMKTIEEGMTDYEWVIHCAKWEVAMYGEIQHVKNSEGINSRIVSISSRS